MHSITLNRIQNPSVGKNAQLSPQHITNRLYLAGSLNVFEMCILFNVHFNYENIISVFVTIRIFSLVLHF